MLCCQRHSGLSPLFYKKIELLENQLSVVFQNSIIDLFIIKFNKSLSQDFNNCCDVQLIYRTSVEYPFDGQTREMTETITKMMTAISSFGMYYKQIIIHLYMHLLYYNSFWDETNSQVQQISCERIQVYIFSLFTKQHGL